MDTRRFLYLWVELLALATILTAAPVGELKVNIKEYDVPTPKSRPHDPAYAPDGALWYTGQLANKLGRLDPKTGEIKEYPLKTPDSGPHGLTVDKDGNVWFTAAFKGYVGKLDPKTGNVTEYPMPEPAAKDPHTPVFDQAGILWFTVQNSNFVGRLDPKSGDIKLKKVPTEHAVPYGIVITPKGIPIFCEFAPTSSPASIRRRWTSTNTRCPTARVLAGSRSRRTGPFITRTTPAATWVTWIPRPVRWRSGRRRAGPLP